MNRADVLSKVMASRHPPEVIVFLVLLFGTVAFSRDFAHLHVTVGGLPLYVTEAGLGVLTALVLWRRVRDSAWRELRSPLDLWMALWMAVGLIELGRGLHVEVLRSLRDFAIVYYAAFFYLARSIFTPAVRVRWLMGVVLAGTLVRIGLTTSHYVLGADLLGRFHVAPVEFTEYDRRIGRYMAGYDGLYLVAACLVVAALWQPRTRKSLLFLYLCFSGFSLLLTQHRTLLIVTLLGWGTLWAVSRWEHLPRPVSLIGWCLGSLLLWGLLTAAAHQRFDLELWKKFPAPLEYRTSQFRWDAWREARHRFAENPILGEGFGRPFVFYAHSSGRWFVEDVRPHNTYLTVLYKMGVLGLAVFAGLHLAFFQWVVRLWRAARAPEGRLHAAGYGAALLALQVYGGLNLLLESPFTALVYWSLMGIIVAWLERAPGEAEAERASLLGRWR